jgi:peroxiredoxin
MCRLVVLISAILMTMALPAFSLLEVGTVAPDFEFSDIATGNNYKLSDYKGSVVLIDFFYLNCTYCRLHSEFFEKLYQDYKDEGFIIFAVDFVVTDKEEDIYNYILNYGWTFPVFYDQTQIIPSLYDYSGYMPTTYIIGRDGKVRVSNDAYHEESIFRGWIEDALNQEEEDKLGITVSTDKTEYKIDDNLEVFLSLTNPGDLLKADIIFAFGQIDNIQSGGLGISLWFFPDWSTTFKPISLQIPAGFKATKARIINTTVSPSGTPPINKIGDYFFIAALAIPSFPDIVYPISVSTFKMVE